MLFFIQTAIPVLSPVAGIINDLIIPDGEKVHANTELCKILVKHDVGDAQSPQPLAEEPSSPTPAPSPEPSSTTPKESPDTPIPSSLPPVPPVPSKIYLLYVHHLS